MNKCPLTGWGLKSELSNPDESIRGYKYFITEFNKKEFGFLINKNILEEKNMLEQNQHIFRFLILNNMFYHNFRSEGFDLIMKFPEKYEINKSVYSEYFQLFKNVSPKEKLDHLLNTLYNQLDDSYNIKIDKEEFIFYTGFRNTKELDLFLNVIFEKNFIDRIGKEDRSNINVSFSYKGIEEVARLSSSGQNSKRCFVAMSFDKEMKETREAIRMAIGESGYQAIFMDELYPENEQTINDAIISEIKKSKFLVADFTTQNNGVYFEAGFALGRGLKIIYCCEEEDFKKNSHFDIKPFSHILYRTSAELTKKLKHKINAWIE